MDTKVNMTGVSAKGTAATVATAAATLLWTLLAIFVDRVGNIDPETLVTLVGATAIVLGVPAFYWVPETAAVTVPPSPVSAIAMRLVLDEIETARNELARPAATEPPAEVQS